ncbi:MAG: 50S ribosomal protein L22 [Candidatus Aquicultor secundus]|uniref:Large ribosomal subunit protein uL22 n=1 Tax=Candidatus Aquicultor secundus TaxID=1973895 RepID=A0A2M7TAF5_9ACTN|nr:50S ribosomal protein L22 [Candidatus Aquicultor secundus]NCO65266.1 50S ribosomal protein L22 [Solirubrobacter sp.]OIO86253.1 MAG: 50S ribosomal protein L22 [Candidatus Aquicultor secundus]PIU26417.1 MAG: 50S ribosomal protein L22 [Candidatus Aquicultor secundus]PIW22618.1 MAG: 50S ribosomal protein L22 [Candidatus Aquicultor secundus]PIX53143.1 MAG: 50S ribosomal protein L22 [Candidatus Aquicultor secundus]
MAKTAENTSASTRAVARYVRISPLKAQQVISLIRGKDVEDAVATLKFTPKAAARLIIKVLNSAVANAEKNLHISSNRLYVSEAYADQGPTLKRIRPRAMGRAFRIRKRSSHITVVVTEKED